MAKESEPQFAPNPVVIEILEEFLEAARRGEIMAAAIVLVRPDATTCSA